MRKSILIRCIFFSFIIILWLSSLFPVNSLPFFITAKKLAEKTIEEKTVHSIEDYQKILKKKEALEEKYENYPPKSFNAQKELDDTIKKYYSFISKAQKEKFYQALALAEKYYKNQAQTAKKKGFLKISPANALALASNELEVKLYQFFNLPVSPQASNEVVAHKLSQQFTGKIKKGIDISGGVEFVLSFNADELKKKNVSTDDLIAVLRNRVDSKGLTEAEIRLFGNQFIQVRIPIINESEIISIKKLLSQPANLEFRGIYEENPRGKLPLGTLAYERLPSIEDNSFYNVRRTVEMQGYGNINSAYTGRSENGSIAVIINFTNEGAKIFSELTKRYLNRPLAIILNGKVYSTPTVQAQLSSNATITGRFSQEEADNLAIALQSGSLPVKLTVSAESLISATLGEKEFLQSIKAGLIGFLCVLVFLVLYYKYSGLIAIIALVSNIILVIGTMAIWKAAFTLPGIAGIILTIGMAVDANVLIFESIKEQLKSQPLNNSIFWGWKRSFMTILDANITTLLIAFVLIYFGTGSIKGFAYTLAVGIISSIFSSLFLSKIFFDYLTWKNKKSLSGLKAKKTLNFSFIKEKQWSLMLSLIVFAISFLVLLIKSTDSLSIDFTGGTQLSFAVNDDNNNLNQIKEKFNEKRFIDTKFTYRSSIDQSEKNLDITLKTGSDSEENISLIKEKLQKLGNFQRISKNSINPLVGKEFIPRNRCYPDNYRILS